VALAALVAVLVLRALAADEAAGALAATPSPPGPAAAQAAAPPTTGGIRPARVRIPAIGVDATVGELGLNPDRTLEVPDDVGATGWWSGGTRPGGAGPAVVVGHVDSESGPAVFYRLRDLEAGDRVDLVGADGAEVTFTVDDVATVPKDAFPTAAVYGPTPAPSLRLVTCGGEFDDETEHYRSNTIAYATYRPT
jgi:sortase (surface protein transpeptidase)